MERFTYGGGLFPREEGGCEQYLHDPDIVSWLQSPGDMDDFIYYGEDVFVSER